ncbi:MAG: DUF1572 family protein [Ferruginibacter sp.]|nr:DUF1572 family protein [Chitinophagaceae bacterium]
MNLENEFLKSAVKRLAYYKELGDKTFAQLKEEDFHFTPNAESNSIALIIQHMAGNMLSRWTGFLTTDGEKEWRNRDTEFEEQHLTKAELIILWQKGWDCLFNSLHTLTEEDLLKTIYIRSEGLLVIDAINRQMAHYPYHVGQIIYLAKVIKNEDWQNLSIAKGHSNQFNKQMHTKP